jgi:cell division septation protein DedD
MASQGRRRRLEIGWLEAAVLTVGYLASLALVYVLGIYVGKGVQQRRLGAEERLIRLPIPEGSGAGDTARSGQEPDLTFYDTLAKGAAAPPARAPRGEGRIIVTDEPGALEPSPAAAAGGAAAGAAPGVDREPASSPAGAARVGMPAAPSPQAEAPTAAREDAPPRAVPTPEAVATARRPPPGVTPEAAATARALAAAPLAPRPSAPSPAPAAPPTAGAWTVQVDATKEAAVAESLARTLRERGYDAFVVKQARGGETWYRVRVGRFPTIERANALVTRLKEREGLPRAFVASE